MMNAAERAEGAGGRGPTGDVDLLQLARSLWSGRWLILSVTAAFAVGAIAYALLAKEWYRAEALIAKTDQDQTFSLGGAGASLAALAGISLNDRGGEKPVEVLRSRSFINAFLAKDERLELVKQVAGLGKRAGEGGATRGKDERLAVAFFREKLLRVTEDSRRGVVTVSIEWTDPATAAAWVNELIGQLNLHMRNRASAEAEANIKFLNEELSSASLVAMRQSAGRLLEVELQKLMMARGEEAYSFRVLDPAEPPIYRSRPRRSLLVVAATILGGLLASAAVLVHHTFRRQIPPERSGC